MIHHRNNINLPELGARGLDAHKFSQRKLNKQPTVAIDPTAGRFFKSVGAFCITALLAITATAQIASGTTGIDASGNAASEAAACNSGASQQSRETCLTEVRNANAAKRAGQVDNAGGKFKANALARCNVFQGEDKVACEARVAGLGSPQGSVAGGGVVTEVETVLVPKGADVINIQPQTNSDTIILIPAK